MNLTHDDLIAIRANRALPTPEAAPDEGVDIPELEAHTLDPVLDSFAS